MHEKHARRGGLNHDAHALLRAQTRRDVDAAQQDPERAARRAAARARARSRRVLGVCLCQGQRLCARRRDSHFQRDLVARAVAARHQAVARRRGRRRRVARRAQVCLPHSCDARAQAAAEEGVHRPPCQLAGHPAETAGGYVQGA
jgi:hypothetical protein